MFYRWIRKDDEFVLVCSVPLSALGHFRKSAPSLVLSPCQSQHSLLGLSTVSPQNKVLKRKGSGCSGHCGYGVSSWPELCLLILPVPLREVSAVGCPCVPEQETTEGQPLPGRGRPPKGSPADRHPLRCPGDTSGPGALLPGTEQGGDNTHLPSPQPAALHSRQRG